MTKRSLQRVATCVAALCVSGSAFAKEPSRRTAEGPADIIEKAQNLSLQKDRTQAVNILVSAIRRESPSSPAAKEMKSVLQDISGFFEGDKAQQVYELALSLRKNDVNQAQAKIAEALRIEPDNLRLLNEAARLLVIKGDCSSAGDAMNRHRKWNPYDEQSLLVAAQAAVCQGDWPAYTALRSQADNRKGPYAKSWAALEVERALKEKSDSRAKEALAALQKADPAHPEIPYWQWRLETDRSKQNSEAQKYLMGCKNLSAAQYRRYMMETSICRRTAEVEAFLKTTGSP